MANDYRAPTMMPAVTLRAFHNFSELSEMGTIMFLIFEKKWRPREMKQLAKDHPARLSCVPEALTATSQASPINTVVWTCPLDLRNVIYGGGCERLTALMSPTAERAGGHLENT